MPCRPSISLRVAASSSSLPFMNLAAKPSMFLPSVTSVTSEARAASSFSTAGGSGSGESWAAASAAAPSTSAPNCKNMLCVFIALILPRGHVPRLFALSPFFPLLVSPTQPATQKRHDEQRRGQAHPDHRMRAPLLSPPLHH